ncbi:hypothetical protein [Variovorax sp. Varisp62]|uniref:hypothetical protein n=1 Tax=Variovorax sp. Varisp62 TaxID=3243049 RepID=UPI0039B50627
MTTRIIAWVVFLGVCWGVYSWARTIKNPFNPGPDVTAVMPAMTQCKEDCKQ